MAIKGNFIEKAMAELKSFGKTSGVEVSLDTILPDESLHPIKLMGCNDSSG